MNFINKIQNESEGKSINQNRYLLNSGSIDHAKPMLMIAAILKFCLKCHYHLISTRDLFLLLNNFKIFA